MNSHAKPAATFGELNWEDARLFLEVAEGGSLSAGARRLRVAQPTVSRRLAALEATLGELLFVRGVGGATLTSFGERLLAPARRMAECAAEFERATEEGEGAPRGVVRLTAPPGIAFDFVVPFAAALRDELPEVRLEVVATIQYLDLGRREADLAIRTQRPVQRDLICLAEQHAAVAAFASRVYVERLPRGYGFADVHWIGWAPPLDHLSPNRELAARIPGFSPAFASDDFVVQLRAAEVGLGAMVLSRARHRFSRIDRLIELDLDFGAARGGAYLVTTKGALAIPRVRAVGERLAHEFARTTEAKKRARPPHKRRITPA